MVVDAVPMWSMPAYEPIPMAVPIALPEIPMGIAITMDDGANDASWSAEGADDAEGAGDGDDDGDDDDGDEEKFDATPVPMATPIAVQYVDPIPLPVV